MNQLIFLDEVLLALCWMIAIFIVTELIITPQGNGLKKILVWYFIVEVYIYFGLAMYILFYQTAFIIPYIPFVIPKVIIKVFFYNYIKKQKYDRRTTSNPTRGSDNRSH